MTILSRELLPSQSEDYYKSFVLIIRSKRELPYGGSFGFVSIFTCYLYRKTLGGTHVGYKDYYQYISIYYKIIYSEFHIRVGIIQKRKPALISRLFFMPLSLPWPHLCVEDFQYPHLVGSGTFYY